MNTVNKQIISRLVPISICLLTIYSILPYVKRGIPFVSSLNNTALWWGVSVIILLVFFFSRFYFFDKRNADNTLIIWIYLLWNAVCIIRGMFEAEHYWDWKGLTGNAMALMLPIVIFSATNKQIVQSMLSFYIKYLLPLFVFFLLIIRTDAFGFYLIPITFLLLLLPALTKRQKILLLALTAVVIVADLGARSNVLKFGIPLLILTFYYLKDKIPANLLEVTRLALFIIPLVLFLLGVSGTFNVFNMKDYIKGDFTSVGTDDAGNRVELDITTDTRTFIYEEVLISAIDNNYWMLGRTPARGNDSYTFGLIEYELTGRNERLANEVGLANVFTWTGLLGVVLYLIIFYRASYLAVNRSNNIYVKMLGVYIAFRWLYCWIEDVNNFTINYFMLMIMIGLCFSYSFRKMTDNEVMIWVRGIFDVRYVHLQQYLLNKSKNEKSESGRLVNVSQQEE